MLGSTLLLIVDGSEETSGENSGGTSGGGEAAVEKALSAVPPYARPQLKTLTLDALLDDPPSPVGPTAAWLLLTEQTSPDAEFTATAALQDKHIPTAVCRPGQDDPAGTAIDAGVVACPSGGDPAATAATISTLLASASAVQSMSREVRVLQAQSSGMAGQFDKIDEELRMALKIQREFLPKTLPEVDGFKFDVLWRPASYVGGDIYDVMRLDEHHVGVFIADAVGHGVPAALMTVYIKQAMVTRQITPGIGPGYRIVPPGEAIAGLNKAMIAQDAGAASLGTAAYGIIDTRTQRLTVARAGHPAPLLLRGNGDTQWLEPDGAMLGIFPEETFEELTFDLDDDDRFLLYSDGFEVAFPGCGGKGKLANEHYAEEFEGLRQGTGQEALDFLQGRLDMQSGSLNQRDDLTVVCASVKALANIAGARAEFDALHDRRSVA